MNVNVASFGSPAGPAHSDRFGSAVPTPTMAAHALASSLPWSSQPPRPRPTSTSTSQLWGGSQPQRVSAGPHLWGRDTHAAASQAATSRGLWGGGGGSNVGCAQALHIPPRNFTTDAQMSHASRTPSNTAHEQQADYFMELLQDASPLTARPSAIGRPAPVPVRHDQEGGGASCSGNSLDVEQTFER